MRTTYSQAIARGAAKRARKRAFASFIFHTGELIAYSLVLAIVLAGVILGCSISHTATSLHISPVLAIRG